MMLVNVAAFVFHAKTSRILGVAEYGSLYALMALLPLVAVPATVLSTVVTKFAAEFRVLHDDAHLHGLVRKMARGLAAAGILIVCAALLFRSPTAAFMKVSPNSIVAAGMLVALAIMLPPLRGVLQGIEDFGRFAVSSAIEGIFKTTLGITFASIGFGTIGALVGYALGIAAALGYTWLALERLYVGTPAELPKIDVRRTFQTAGGAAVLTITVTALSYADVLIVKHFMPATAAGLYAAVSLGGKILLFVVGFLPLVLLPKAASQVARGASPLPTLAASAALWGILCACGLAIFYVASPIIVRILFGPQFLAASALMFDYAVAMTLLGGMSVVGSYKIALHRFDFIYPFIIVALGELVTITMYHPNLKTVIDILIVGNAAGLLTALYGIRKWR